MERDLAIVYQSELYKTKKIISKLNDLGLDTTNYENAIYDIEETCRNSNKEDLKRGLDSPFMVDYLEANYSKAINNIKILQSELSKYETYIKVNSFTTLLKNIIKNNKITSKQLDEITPQLINILNDLKKSNTLDYATEKNIVEGIYKITYYLLKEEIKLGKTTLYDFLLKDEIHTTYLDKEISLELKQLDKNDAKNNDILNRKNLLDLNGVNSHYLDYELLTLLVKVNNKEENIYELFKLTFLYQEIDNELDIYSRGIENMYHQIQYNEKEVHYYRKPSRYLKNIGSMVISASIIATLFGGPFVVYKKVSHNNSLKKITISTYDSRDNSEKEEEPFYLDNYSTDVIVTKYEPYERENDGYYRYVTKYNLGKVNNLSNEEILNIDFDGLGIKKDIEREYEYNVTYENIYKDIYYTISKVNIDENDTSFVYTYIFAMVEAVIFAFYSSTIDSVYGKRGIISIGLIRGIIKIKEDIKNIKEISKEKERYIRERKRMINEVKELLNKYDSELRNLFKHADFICEYGNNETAIKLREVLESINYNLYLIEEKEQGTIVKDTVSKIKKRTR